MRLKEVYDGIFDYTRNNLSNEINRIDEQLRLSA